MATQLKDGGLTPSATALKDSLNLKPGISLGPTMLTASQQELLRRDAKEALAYLESVSEGENLETALVPPVPQK
jgi:hypothetical protein